MSFLLKSAVALLVIALAGGFVINQIPSWKQKVVEIVNPAAKEARLLGELSTNLDDLDKTLRATGENPDEKIKNSRELLEKSKSLINEIASTNEQNSGIVKQQIGKIIDALLDKTPFPADHLSPSESSITPLVCPPTQ